MSVTTVRAADARPRNARHRPRTGGGVRLARSATPGALTVVINLDDASDPRFTSLLHSLRSLAAARSGGRRPPASSRASGTTAIAAGSAPPVPATRAVAGTPRVHVKPGTLVIDGLARTLLDGDTEIVLTRKEFDLLHYLVSHPGRVHTRQEILAHVWGQTESGGRTVDIHVRRLRAKTGDRPLIATVWTVGYRLADGAPIVDAHA